MARQKRYIERNVYEEAKKRIHHIYDTHDHVNVAFSGGKDSGVVLNMVLEVAQERGLSVVDCHHRDEEFNPSFILDNIKHYFDMPHFNMTWYCVPRSSTMFVLGKSIEIVKWDASGEREWVRPKPDWAETLNDTKHVFGQDDFDAMIANTYPTGKVGIINGVRAEESLVRYRSVVNKVHDNYIVKSFHPRASLCKPIYDWLVQDVFKYFYVTGHRYSAWYEQQLWSGDALRVASPLIAESMKSIEKWASMDPEFYNRLTAVFPEVRAHERYKGTISQQLIIDEYGKDMNGVLNWIKANVDEESSTYRTMMAKWKNLQRLTQSEPERYMPDGTCTWILKHFINGKILHGDIYPPTTARIRNAKRRQRPKINKSKKDK